MLTFYHSPNSRSTRLLALVHGLGILDDIDLKVVGIRRQDGSGAPDPKNPHPEGKVPLLVHDGVEIWESAAIMLYLTDMYPDANLGVPVGDALRGRYLSWLAWYGDVLEPVGLFMGMKIEHPALQSTCRGWPEAVARLETALTGNDWLVGDHYTAADLIVASLFAWQPSATPDIPAVKDWVARCLAQPFLTATADHEKDLSATMAA